jgi:hypothetical protein
MYRWEKNIMKVDTQPIITELGLHKVITSQSTETELTARVKVEENKDAQAVSIKQNELEREEKKCNRIN